MKITSAPIEIEESTLDLRETNRMAASALLNRFKRRLVKQMNHNEEARKASCESYGEDFDYDPNAALVTALNELGFEGLYEAVRSL